MFRYFVFIGMCTLANSVLIRAPMPWLDASLAFFGASSTSIDLINIEQGAIASVPSSIAFATRSIAFNSMRTCMFHTDYTNMLHHTCMNGTNTVTNDVLYVNSSVFNSLSFDWTSNLLYFIDGQKIDVLKWAENHFVLHHLIEMKTEGLQPKSVVISPVDGWLFFVQQHNNVSNSVWRAHLDGTNLEMVIDLPLVSLIQSFTIDLSNKRLYWIETLSREIWGCDFDGEHLAKFDLHYAHAPLSLAFHNGWVFWYDLELKGIYATRDNNLDRAQLIVHSNTHYHELLAIGKTVQNTTNACSGASHMCSYACVGAPNNGHSCLCADGTIRSVTGHCLCANTLSMPVNGTCPLNADGSCVQGFFKCSTTNRCISDEKKCNGVDDCGDNSDEVACVRQGLNNTTTTKATCHPTQFQCDNGSCVPG